LKYITTGVDMNIAGYIRVSVVHKEDKERDKYKDDIESLLSQREKIESYVKTNYPKAKLEIYRDEGKSGKSIEGRPEFKRLLSEIDKYNIVIVSDLSRGFRSLKDCIDVIAILKKKNITFI
jgi:site-specific DNA recombinase